MTRGAPAEDVVPTRDRPLELHGRVAIVTGGAKGIGRSVSELLAREGAQIVLGGRDPGPLDELARALSAGSAETRAVAHPCDVTSEAETQSLAQCALDSFGRIDILVNTAGGTGPVETP